MMMQLFYNNASMFFSIPACKSFDRLTVAVIQKCALQDADKICEVAKSMYIS